MGRGKDHCRVKSDFLLNLFRQVADDRARHGQFAEELFRKSQHIDELVIPGLGSRVDQVRAGRVRVFLFHHAGELIVKIVRDHQHCLSPLELLRMFFLKSHELVDRVEELLLDAGARVELLRGNDFVHKFVGFFGAAVSVGDGVADRISVLVDQDEIYGPGVNADGLRYFASLFAGLKTSENSAPEIVHIPAVVAVLVYLFVVKAVHLFQNNSAVLDMAENVAAAGCADVNRKIVFCHS